MVVLRPGRDGFLVSAYNVVIGDMTRGADNKWIFTHNNIPVGAKIRASICKVLLLLNGAGR